MAQYFSPEPAAAGSVPGSSTVRSHGEASSGPDRQQPAREDIDLQVGPWSAGMR
jgi:hypothetical protein